MELEEAKQLLAKDLLDRTNIAIEELFDLIREWEKKHNAFIEIVNSFKSNNVLESRIQVKLNS